MGKRSTGFHSFALSIVTVALLLWGGCGFQPLQRQSLEGLGHFEYRPPDQGHDGIIVGVPSGSVEPAAVDYGWTLRRALGAGLVIAYDFTAKRIPVDRPVMHISEIDWSANRADDPQSVYLEFKKILRHTTHDKLKFYVGVRLRTEAEAPSNIEVVSSGLTFEQLQVLKRTYQRLRAEALAASAAPSVDIAIAPFDAVSEGAGGIKKHGVLMLSGRGLILRLPKLLARPELQRVYQPLLAEWVQEAAAMGLRNPRRLVGMEFEILPWGRFDYIASRKHIVGAVIAAPHGSFDWYTGELAEAVGYTTGLATLITRGFTPTECAGWRIDVNRPTERRYPPGTLERESPRAKQVFERYARRVAELAAGPLELYIELHQNSSVSEIDVATVGLSRQQSRALKNRYRQIRDLVLADFPDVAKVELVIEPEDQVSIGAWAAKTSGILKRANTAVHFELPAHRIFHRQRTLQAYQKILTELIQHLVNSLQTSGATRMASE